MSFDNLIQFLQQEINLNTEAYRNHFNQYTENGPSFELLNLCEKDLDVTERCYNKIHELKQNNILEEQVQVDLINPLFYHIEKLFCLFTILKNNIEIDIKSMQSDYFYSNNLTLENEKNELIETNENLKQDLETYKREIQELQSQENTQDLKRKKHEHWLRILTSIAIFGFLVIQFIFIAYFIWLKPLPPKYLTPILLAIAGQSYFLPSFTAKYLFNNDGVTTQNNQAEPSKDFKGFGFDFKWYK